MPFLPLTATPFPRPGYREMLPCRKLVPYVRCFWTSWNERKLAGREAESSDFAGKIAVASGRDALAEAASVIIPDLCADIIIETDGIADCSGDREITGMGFCGVNDRMFRSGHSVAACKRLFGIRFYAWQASRFSDEPLSGTANGFFDLHAHFAAFGKMLRNRFSPRMDLAGFAHTSEEILLSLLARPVQDAVFAYGYFDQAHLLHDFKKFHGMSLGAARRTAALSAFYNTRA